MSGAEADRPAAAPAGVFLGTFALILLAMAALFALNLVLAGLERRERRSEARHYYEQAMTLARQGRRSESIDRLQSAIAAERSNPVYQRALAAELLAAGRAAEARGVISALLQHDPGDAEASRLMAQSLVQERKPEEAVTYYHRAIYGQWDGDSAGNRVRTRLELVELLARMDAQRELLAELLPLRDEAPDDLVTRRRVAQLFLEAGAPSRAIELYREILREQSRDAETYAGLAEAELARGNYRRARADFARAMKLAPEDSSIARRLGLAQLVIALDPTQRGLSAAEQYRRSLVLVSLTLRAAQTCARNNQKGANQALADSARGRMVLPAPVGTRHERFESNLDLAERLWELRPNGCAGLPGAVQRPVDLVMERVAQ